MTESGSEENELISISNNNFKKIFHHLCLAAKKHTKHEKKDNITSTYESNIISEKIEAIEKKKHSISDDWIKNKLEQLPQKNRNIILQKREDPKDAEIKDIKNHILEIRKSYETLKQNKGVSKEKLKALKERIERLENMLRNDSKKTR